MDETLRVWDVRSFAPEERCVHVMDGHAHGFERNMLRCAWSRWRRDARTGDVHVPPPPAGDDDEAVGDGTAASTAYVSGDSLVAAGSSDRCVHVWNAATAAPAFRLPGHKGTVNAVDFHPSEPVLATGGQDRTIYLGELVQEYANGNA